MQQSSATTTPINGQNGLKKLTFVPALAERSTAVAAGAYSTAKRLVPEGLKPTVENVESTVSTTAAPYVHKAQDAGASLLHAVDDRVAAAADRAAEVYDANRTYLTAQLQKQREFHAQNLEAYKSAREAYLKKVEDAVEFLKQNGVQGAARKAADEVLALVGEAKGAVLATPGYLLNKVHAAVDRLLAFGPVSSAVEAAKPTLGAAQSQYMRLHDQLVASQQYKQVYSLAGEVAQRAQQTWVYQRLFPLARPAYDTVSSSPYFNSLVQHLQPIEAAH